MTVAELLERLEDVHRDGEGWKARCPAHEDRRPSLGVLEGADGRIVLRCRAGCETSAVLAALGLELRDLFAEPPATNGHREISATYDYRTADGELAYQVVRFDPKDFRQRRPDGAGGWIWNLQGVDRILYRLPDVLAAVERGGPVWIVEGE